MKCFVRAATLMAVGSIAVPVHAQGLPVFDSSTFAQTLAAVQNTLRMVQQGEQQITQAQALFGSLNKLTNVNSVAALLNMPAVRNLLPAEAQDISKLMSGDLGSIGPVGTRAGQILQGANLQTGDTASSKVAQAYQAALQVAGQKSAANAAVAEAAFTVTTLRTQGLEQLRTALDSATDAKQTADLEARIAVEAAHIQNDQMQLQALAMRQAAQDRLDLEADDARHARNLNATIGK